MTYLKIIIIIGKCFWSQAKSRNLSAEVSEYVYAYPNSNQWRGWFVVRFIFFPPRSQLSYKKKLFPSQNMREKKNIFFL